jgi:uncharacterized membrane protein
MFTPNYDDISIGVECDTPQTQRPSMLNRCMLAIFVLGSVGLGLSLFMIALRYSSKPGICEFGDHISCQKIESSSFSTLFRVPLPVFGSGWFLILLGLTWMYRTHMSLAAAVPILAWSALGTLFVFYLVIVEIALGFICPLCTIIHLITLIVFSIAVWTVHEYDCSLKPTNLFNHLQVSRKFCMVVLMTFGIPIVLFNGVWLITRQDTPPVSPSYGLDLAICLNKSHVEMFGDNRCSHCNEQKNLFGAEVRQLIRFWDCSIPSNLNRCSELNVKFYPTWIQFNNITDGTETEIKRNVGMMSLFDLAQWASCPFHP